MRGTRSQCLGACGGEPTCDEHRITRETYKRTHHFSTPASLGSLPSTFTRSGSTSCDLQGTLFAERRKCEHGRSPRCALGKRGRARRRRRHARRTSGLRDQQVTLRHRRARGVQEAKGHMEAHETAVYGGVAGGETLIAGRAVCTVSVLAARATERDYGRGEKDRRSSWRSKWTRRECGHGHVDTSLVSSSSPPGATRSRLARVNALPALPSSARHKTSSAALARSPLL
jgi:hypothetical protein